MQIVLLKICICFDGCMCVAGNGAHATREKQAGVLACTCSSTHSNGTQAWSNGTMTAI